MAVLNNAEVSSQQFGAAGTTLEINNVATVVTFDISNSAIYYRLREKPAAAGLKPESWPWGDEVFAAPSFRSLDRICSGIQLRRAATAGDAPQVTVELVEGRNLGG